MTNIMIVRHYTSMNPRMLAFYGAIISYSGALVSFYAGQYEMALLLVILGVVNMCQQSKLRKQEKH